MSDINKKEIILNDIMKKINRLKLITKDINFENFKENINIQEIVLYNLITIGEACSILKKKYGYENNQIISFLKENRNQLTHQYWISKEKKQWNILKKSIPILEEEIKK